MRRWAHPTDGHREHRGSFARSANRHSEPAALDLAEHLVTWDLVIVVDGASPVPGWKALVAPTATVIAADGGARHARNEAVTVTDLVGDLDSLTPAEVDWFTRGGTRVHRFDVDKDFTDFELAARLVRHRAHPGVEDVLVVGGAGGRLDHALGNIAVLGGDDLAAFSVTALLGDAVTTVASSTHPVSVGDRAGQVVSLVPVGTHARGVTTQGMRFELHDEALDVRRTRGLSNVVAAPPASVTLDEGRLLVIEPDAVSRLIHDNRGAVP